MASRKVYFYNSRNRDRLYNADSMTDWLNPFFTTGVFNNCFRVTANNNMTVTVAGGYANIEGKTVNYSGSETFDLTVASGTLSRIDNIILRRDDTTRDIYLMVQTGGLSVNPVPPPIIRENAIYDLKLAEVRVNKGTITVTQANVTDTRMNAAVCGWVVATVKEIDFSGITAQFEAFFNAYKPKIEDEYKDYIAACNNFFQLYNQFVIDQYQSFMNALNAYRTNSATEYEALLLWFENFKMASTKAFDDWFNAFKSGNSVIYYNWYNAFKSASESSFNDWFENLQNQLNDNQAANLQNQISQHNNTVATEDGGIHGIRYLSGKLQIQLQSGWATVAQVTKGLRSTYVDAQNKTTFEIDSRQYTSLQINNLIEVEA